MAVDFEIIPVSTLPRMGEALLTANSFGGKVFRPKPAPRRLQRIALSERITAEFGSDRAIIIDISLSGVLLAHDQPSHKGEVLKLKFDWHGETVYADVQVMRTELHRSARPNVKPTHRSGVAFVRHSGSSECVLRQMMTELVERALDERRANARGVPPHAATFVRSGKARVYQRLRLVNGAWQIIETSEPAQPVDGFTVSVDEDPGQVKILCETYEKLAESDRELVRKMAAMTLANPEGTPARRYDP